jgi:hypothetical protein
MLADKRLTACDAIPPATERGAIHRKVHEELLA